MGLKQFKVDGQPILVEETDLSLEAGRGGEGAGAEAADGAVRADGEGRGRLGGETGAFGFGVYVRRTTWNVRVRVLRSTWYVERSGSRLRTT